MLLCLHLLTWRRLSQYAGKSHNAIASIWQLLLHPDTMVTSAFVALLCQSFGLTVTRNIKLANQLQNLGLSDLAIAAGSCSLFNTSFPSLSVKRTFFHWQYHVSPRASLDGFRILIEIYAGKKKSHSAWLLFYFHFQIRRHSVYIHKCMLIEPQNWSVWPRILKYKLPFYYKCMLNCQLIRNMSELIKCILFQPLP